jgi:hypothetical protein
MKLTAAGERFTVLIPDRPIIDEHGDELDGLAVSSPKLILISRRIVHVDREAVLLHELQHAWEFYMPAPRTAEERCQMLATIARQFRVDLDNAGGIEALHALKPTRVSLPFDAPATVRESAGANTFRVMDFKLCGSCEAPTMCGSIEYGHVEFHEGLQQHQVLRWFRCETCGTLNVWREVATSDGRPTGVLVQVPPPRMMRGREAAAWLAENAGATVG